MKTLSIWIVLPFLALLGCENKQESATPPPAPPAVEQPTPAPAAPPTPAPQVAAADLPTSEDFEEQALKEINPQNIENELDKLEKDIGQ